MRKSRKERLKYFEQEGEWSKEEHLCRHKALIKERKKEIAQEKKERKKRNEQRRVK